MLAPNPLVTTTSWPIAGDVPDLQAIVWSQMATIKANEALLHAYQANLNNAQVTPPATALATAPGTTQINITGLLGTIVLPATITNGGLIPSGTYLVGQTSGPTGGNGTYTTNTVLTLTSTPVFIYPNGANPPWPSATDQGTLMLLTQDQMAVARLQNSLLTAYQTLLADSSTPPPATGP
jgi:hypothetical protein